MNLCIKYQSRHITVEDRESQNRFIVVVVRFFSGTDPFVIVMKELFKVFNNPSALQSVFNGHPARRLLDKKAFHQCLS